MPLYAWGANSCGQLGLGQKSDKELQPKVVSLENSTLKAENIVSICGGSGHTLVLDNNGHVYCCGLNTKGQLGVSNDTLKVEQIEILKGFKVVQISCGWDFSTAITDCGKCFVWGNNQYTQLGLSRSITCTGIPSMLQVSQKLATGFTKVSSGGRHAAIITAANCLLVAGTGAKGQLGLGDNFSDDNYLSICKVPEIEDVRSVACGQSHTVVLRRDGTVLSWGDNKHGQLGLDPAQTPSMFVPTEVYANEGVEQVCAGWTHTTLLTSAGEIINFGRNTYGQLGEPRDTPHKPQTLSSLKDVAQLSCGSEHNLAVTKDGKLYSWGWNDHGSCGTGDNKNVETPKRIDLKDGAVVKAAWACTGGSFALVE